MTAQTPNGGEPHREGSGQPEFSGPIRIALFEDSREIFQEYRRRFGSKATLRHFEGAVLDNTVSTALRMYGPELFIVDLILGSDRDDGIRLIRLLQGDPTLKRIPIVVVSKLINESPAGQAMKARCLTMDGVVGAFSKFPELPTLQEVAAHLSRLDG